MRGIGRRVFMLCLVLAMALAATSDVAGGRRAIIVRAATFTYLPRGWETLPNPNTVAVLTPAGAETESTALSCYKPDSFGWANAMPPRAIAVQLLLIRRSGDAWKQIAADPELLRRYNALKRAHEGGSLDEYQAAKGEFFRKNFSA